MKLALCVGAFLAVPGIAAADTAQGKLTGSGTPSGQLFAIDATVVDGGTSYVGAGNDLSGNCDGDSGAVSHSGGPSYNVFCAHFVLNSGCCNAGSPKMRFAYEIPIAPGVSLFYAVRITDNGGLPDTYAYTFFPLRQYAQSYVNLGAAGTGNPSGWAFSTVTSGNYTVTP